MTIAVTNQKGGVGKTALAVHLAEYAREQGKRVLVVDTDPQGNATSFFGHELAPAGAGASALFRKGASPQPVEVREGLALIPADDGSRELADVRGTEDEIVMRPRGHLAAIAQGFDLVVIDTPPTAGRRQTGALAAADGVVTPIAVDSFSLKGLTALLRVVNEVKQRGINPALRNLGAVVNHYNGRSEFDRGELAKLRAGRFGPMVMDGEIGGRKAVGVALSVGHPVWKYTNGESARKAGKEMRAACAAILRRAGA